MNLFYELDTRSKSQDVHQEVLNRLPMVPGKDGEKINTARDVLLARLKKERAVWDAIVSNFPPSG